MDTQMPGLEFPMVLAISLMLVLPSVVYVFTTYGKAHNWEEWLENPLTAAILNLCPWPPGLGYVYLGRWRRFFQVWLGAMIIGLAVRSSDASQARSAVHLVILALSLIIAWDAYKMAKRSKQPLNAQLARNPRR